MSDLFQKKKLSFDIDEIKREVEDQRGALIWNKNEVSGPEFLNKNDRRYRDGSHGTTWCYVKLTDALIGKIEDTIGCPVHREVFYLWDYGSRKNLPMHIDEAENNCGKVIACVLPLVGRFCLRMYRESDPSTRLGECVYGPGELILINNRKYFHDGLVLDETRLAIHFFLAFEKFLPESSLSEMLAQNSICRDP